MRLDLPLPRWLLTLPPGVLAPPHRLDTHVPAPRQAPGRGDSRGQRARVGRQDPSFN